MSLYDFLFHYYGKKQPGYRLTLICFNCGFGVFEEPKCNCPKSVRKWRAAEPDDLDRERHC